MAKEKNQAGADTAPASLEEATAQELTLTAKLEATEAENATLKADAEKADKTISDLKSELTDAAEVISDLKSQAEVAGSGNSKGPIVKIGKSEYLVIGGTVIKQKAYKPEDIAADKQLCENLIERGSTLLVKLN